LDSTTTHGPARSTALHIAASVGFLNGIDAILLRQQQNSNNEIDLDPIINALDKHGQTPLHSAILSNQSACVELLLKYGARMDIQDNQGQLPLHLSVFYRRIECTKCLLKYLPENTKLLWIPNKVDQRNVMEECIVGGYNNKDNRINNNINKSNLIRLAVFWNRIECLELLLGAGFSSSHTQQDVGTQQQMTETDPINNNDILYQAVQQRKLDIVQCLRRKGNMNPCVSNGHNPSLIYAASHGFLDMIPFLLTRDTSIDCIRQAILLSEPLGL
ncbi:ankyrin repeat-containing domain protein, partial [Circinella umbellata]